jgi:hypothetical protein
MKKRIIVAVLAPLLIIALAGVSQAGQKKVDDPHGLLLDETDFLTPPSKIASMDQLQTVDTLTDYYYLNGDGERNNPDDNVLNLLKMGKTRVQWSTGSGVSVLFDL